ncbi:response regulator transcription factor [soil metagenome]
MSRIFLLKHESVAAERLCDIVLRTTGLELVGAASTLAHARPMLQHGTTDLLVSDLRLADGRPTELTDELRGPGRRGWPLLLVVARSFEDPQLMYALRHGADGYVMQDDSMASTAATIKLVLGGGSPMSAGLARQVKAQFAAGIGSDGRAVVDYQSPAQLTRHEKALLNWLAEGESAHEIARSLQLSNQQIDVRVRNIYRKMQHELRAASLSLVTV